MMPTVRPIDDSDDTGSCKETLIHLGIGPFRVGIDWLHWCYKALAYSLLITYLFFAWWLFSPSSPAWSSDRNDVLSIGHGVSQE